MPMEVAMDSILNTIKKLIGLDESYTVFDLDIITYINSVFFILNQIGVGPETPFRISDSTATWDDFAVIDSIEAVKTYVAKRVQLMFDTPTSGALSQAMKEQSDELGFRLMISEDNST